jgi:hypothetical protein
VEPIFDPVTGNPALHPRCYCPLHASKSNRLADYHSETVVSRAGMSEFVQKTVGGRAKREVAAAATKGSSAASRSTAATATTFGSSRWDGGTGSVSAAIRKPRSCNSAEGFVARNMHSEVSPGKREEPMRLLVQLLQVSAWVWRVLWCSVLHVCVCVCGGCWCSCR